MRPTRRDARYMGAHILTSIKPRHCLNCAPPTVSYLPQTSSIQANYYKTHLEMCFYDPSNSRRWHFLFRAPVLFLDWLPGRRKIFRQFSRVVTNYLNDLRSIPFGYCFFGKYFNALRLDYWFCKCI